MGTTPQDVYVTNLEQNVGYPLRSPEPNHSTSAFEQYTKEGLRVGDVGYVNEFGEFMCLFNIRFPLPDDVRKYGVPQYQTVEIGTPYCKHSQLPKDRLFMSGVKRVLNESRPGEAYKFTATSTAGAILALPSGATLFELRETPKLEEFCEVARQNASSWCQFARRDTLYLLTGVYTTCSWALGSFRRGIQNENIIMEHQMDANDAYTWKTAFEVDHRSSPWNNRNKNQTVFIKGFRITVRWHRAVVTKLPGTAFNSQGASINPYIIIPLLFFLVTQFVIHGTWLSQIETWLPRIIVEHIPRLSQPIHPSDPINRYLLEKKPEAQVAITHDNEWIDMLEKKRLSHSDLMQDGPLRVFLDKEYTCHSDDNAAYLRKIEDNISVPCTSESSQPVSATESVQLVITHIRAENIIIGLGRIPIGFYVRFDFNGNPFRRTKFKPIPLHESVIQWDDQIQLHSDSSAVVRLVVCASFESDPVLGNGEPLQESEDICVGSLLDRTEPITLSRTGGDASTPPSSLLITVQRQYSNYRMRVPGKTDGNFYWEDSSELVKETNLGHDALNRYRRDHCKKYLDSAITSFERALDTCRETSSPWRATAMSNLARATFIMHQFDGTSPSLNKAKALYREALELCCAGHPDQPRTLLNLAQAVMYRYGAEGPQAPTEAELREHVNKLEDHCFKDEHERRAADLLLQTYKWIRLRDSRDVVKLDELISTLNDAAQAPPETYFDKPTRFNNLGLALFRRFELCQEFNDLNQAIIWLEKSVRATFNNHLEKPSYSNDLGNALLDRFQRTKGDDDLNLAIKSLEDAVQLTPKGHHVRPTYVDKLCNALLFRFQRQRKTGDLDQAISGLEDMLCPTSDV